MPVSLISNDLMDRFKEWLDETEDELNIFSPFLGTQTATFLADWLVNKCANQTRCLTSF